MKTQRAAWPEKHTKGLRPVTQTSCSLVGDNAIFFML